MTVFRARGIKALFAAALLVSFQSAAGLPAAAADPQAEQGHEIARSWCTSCHLVEPGGAAVDAGPPFAQVANDPNLTPDMLRAWLADPHPPMPNLNLGRQEIEALIAYIATLKN